MFTYSHYKTFRVRFGFGFGFRVGFFFGLGFIVRFGFGIGFRIRLLENQRE